MRCIRIFFKKKQCWVWIAVDRYGKRFINFVIGNGGNETAEEFWEKIKGHDMDYIASDYWKPCESIIPKEKQIQSKKETFTVEGYNSLFRYFLAKMRRKSKYYSKKMEMLAISV
jgi:insertion element IS1 protein InsB